MHLLIQACLLVLLTTNAGRVAASRYPAQDSVPAAAGCQNSTVDILGEKSASAYREFLLQLQAALKAGQKDKIAEMLSYPLRWPANRKSPLIKTRKQFLANYDRIFDAATQEAIAKQSSKCLFGNWQGAMAGSGVVWFRELQDGVVKIIAVNGAVNVR